MAATLMLAAEDVPPAFARFVAALATSPYEFRDSTKCIVNRDTRRPVSGVTTKLRRVFAGGVSAHEARERRPMLSGGVQPGFRAPRGGLPSARRRCKLGGLQHGQLVDSELTACAQHPPAVWHVLLRDADPCTLAVLTSLNRSGMVPVAAQMVVGCAAMNVGTMIDMWCFVPATRRMVLIENKCCRDLRHLRVPAGRMLEPFQQFENTVLNQYYLQLLITLLILEYGYGYVPDEAYLNIVSPNQEPLRVPLPDAWRTDRMREAVYGVMCHFK